MAQLQYPMMDLGSGGKENFNIEEFINGLSAKSINSVSPISSTYNLISDAIFDDLIDNCHDVDRDSSTAVFPGPVYLNQPPVNPITVTKSYIPHVPGPMFNAIPSIPYCLPMDIVPHTPDHIMSCWMMGHPVVTPPLYTATSTIPLLHHKDLMPPVVDAQLPRRPLENRTQQTWISEPAVPPPRIIRKAVAHPTPAVAHPTPTPSIVKSEKSDFVSSYNPQSTLNLDKKSRDMTSSLSHIAQPRDMTSLSHIAQPRDMTSLSHIAQPLAPCHTAPPPTLPAPKKKRLSKKEHKTNPRAKRLLTSLTKPLLDHQRKGVDKISRTGPVVSHSNSNHGNISPRSRKNPPVMLSSQQELVSVILLIKSLYFEQSNPLEFPKRYKVLSSSSPGRNQ